MAYVIGQYNKTKNQDNNIFMSLQTTGTPDRRKNQGDLNVFSEDIFSFEDECVKVGSLNISNSYYFHGKIKRMTVDQTFNIKLCYFNPETEEEQITQYIKTINISAGDTRDWVDVEFIFTPLVTFDCILFELQRIITDFREENRYPLIAYEEFSLINNIIPIKIGNKIKLIKLGVQSRPGLLMCINQEEIRTCRTGVYEIKNGVMTVNFFSVLNRIEEGDTQMQTWISSVNDQVDILDEQKRTGEITPEEYEQRKKAINSRSFFGSTKMNRQIDSFTLDYMYKEE